MLTTRIAHFTQRTFGGAKKLKLRAKKRLNLFEPIEIVPFRGYGISTRVALSGRIVECDGVVHKPSTAEDSALKNLKASIRRLRSDEIPHATLRVRVGGTEVEAKSDNEGYFDVTVELPEPLEPGWHEVEYEIVSSMAGGEGVTAKGEVLVPPQDAEFGIISDIDDTVVHTSATDRLKMVRIVLFKNAHTRIPFPGVAAFYRALKLGPDGRGTNPIFYVSRSPWNLYDLFEKFFEAHRIPRGPLFLRDLSLIEAKSTAVGTGQDKLTRIRKLLKIYPNLSFVLIGDSGQKDPEVYQQIAQEHPGRIRAIYIRDVTSKRRERQVEQIAEDLRQHGVPMILAQQTLEAARHAVEARLITASALEDIAEKKREEERENEES